MRWYLGVQALLIVAALVAPELVASGLWLAIAVFGVVALIVGIYRQHPPEAAGWWFVAAGALAILAGAFAVGVINAVTGEVQLVTALPVTLSILAFPLLAIGLALLGRSGIRSNLADTLDALVAAVGVFLLLWSFLIDPARDAHGASLVEVIVNPIGMLVVFAMAVKLFFSAQARAISRILLVVALAALLGATATVFAAAISSQTVEANKITTLLWGVCYAFFGASGLHPSLAEEVPAPPRPNTQLTWWRITLFALLAGFGPLAWVAEVIDNRALDSDPVGFTVPVVCGAVLALLLLWRLGLTARVAQGRSAALTRQATALGAAIHEQEALQAQLTYRALHDPLTGLVNRTVLAERLDWLLSRLTGGREHALLLMDLDGFKDINDSMGHPVGDELLTSMAHRLLEITPPQGMTVRLGGDEFAILLEDTNLTRVNELAEQILTAIRAPLRVGDRDIFLTTSIGYARTETDADQMSASSLLRDADLALYEAKNTGKNKAVRFHSGLRSARADFARLSAGLHRALAEHEFTLQYQPIIDLSTEEIVAVEALLRWNPPDGPSVLPADFIPVAEENGLIGAIGAWVLRRACADARRWHHERGVAVSVNVSGRQLDDPNLADVVLAALTEARLPGQALIIELTEASLIARTQMDNAVTQLDRLRGQGIRVAIDDFGTGYSSLAYVSHLPVDMVKIDSSFTQHEGHREFVPENWTFTHAILQLVAGLNLQAVAEGIETPEQASALRALSCPLAQGYYFSRPVPPETIDEMLNVAGGVIVK